VTKPFSVKELLLRIRKTIDRQRALRGAQEKEREKDLSLRYLVHELRNSVTVIGGFSSLALRKKDPENYLSKIMDIAQHAERLLNDASLLSRLEMQKGSLPIAPVDLGALIQEVAEDFASMAEEKQITLAHRGGTSSKVLGNASALRQVLANLISNAVKFSPAGSTVRIGVNEETPWLHLSVEDEGRGIPDKDIPRIFGRFYRAAGSEQIKGTGLGLYIAKLLVEAMAGRLSVESALGVGSAFTVSLQKYRPSQDTSPVASSSFSQDEARRSDTSPVRILR
jgi:two-component system phosphate regulon sensor histidine kinase PhoR